MLGEVLAIGAALCFALAATIYMKPLADLRAASASILRFAGTGAILFVLLLFIWGPSLVWSLPSNVILLAASSGVVGLAMGDILYMHSFKKIGVARTVSLVGTYPLFSLAIELAIGRSSIPVLALFGTPLIILGVWVLARRGQVEEDVNLVENRRGVIAGLSTSFLYSVSMLFVDEALLSVVTSGVEVAFAINTLRTLSGGVTLLLFSPLIDRTFGFMKMTRESAALLLLGSLIAYGVGWYSLTLSFTLAPSAIVVPLSATTPLFAAISAVLLLRENVNKRTMIGILATVGGIILLVLA